MRTLAFWIVGGVAALAVLYTIGLAVAARLVGPPADVGAPDGQLAPCGSRRNCAASQGALPAQTLPPIPFSGDAAAAQERTLALLQSLPRVEIITSRPGYIHAVFRSQLFGFPDDVELLFDGARAQIDFRSAARIGQGDMGVNLARMRDLSAQLGPLLR